jgi:hypothetical protein
MKLAIIGSRDFADYSFMLAKFSDYVQTEGFPSHIVSGGAKGADSLAEKLADFYKIPKIIHHADWERLGKRAGPVRSSLIVHSADEVLAFPIGKSVGTMQCISLFERESKPVYDFPSKEEEW